MPATLAVPKAYLVVETELRDPAALALYAPRARAAIEAAGGRRIAPIGGRTIPLVGDLPRRVGITEWQSLEAVERWRASPAFQELASLRNEAVGTGRVFAIEGALD